MVEMPLYTVGIIGKTHGLRGEVRVVSKTDFPHLRFAAGSRLLLVNGADDEVLKELTVRGARPHKGVYIVSFAGVDQVEQGEQLRGLHLRIHEAQLAPLPEGEYFFHQLVGCDVFTDEGERLGVLTEVLTPGANDVYVVQTPAGKEVLLPVIRECILRVDPGRRRVDIHAIPGLLD